MALLALRRRQVTPSAPAEEARGDRPVLALPLHPTVYARVPGLAIATSRLLHVRGA